MAPRAVLALLHCAGTTSTGSTAPASHHPALRGACVVSTNELVREFLDDGTVDPADLELAQRQCSEARGAWSVERVPTGYSIAANIGRCELSFRPSLREVRWYFPGPSASPDTSQARIACAAAAGTFVASSAGQ